MRWRRGRVANGVGKKRAINGLRGNWIELVMLKMLIGWLINLFVADFDE
jgi:hypothetical protein